MNRSAIRVLKRPGHSWRLVSTALACRTLSASMFVIVQTVNAWSHLANIGLDKCRPMRFLSRLFRQLAWTSCLAFPYVDHSMPAWSLEIFSPSRLSFALCYPAQLLANVVLFSSTDWSPVVFFPSSWSRIGTLASCLSCGMSWCIGYTLSANWSAPITSRQTLLSDIFKPYKCSCDCTS